MTEVKQNPVTLITGLSDSLKLSLIKELKMQNNANVVLFRDPTVVYGGISKEVLYQENTLTEVIHDREVCTKKDLLSIINGQINDEVDQLIIDLERFSNIHLLTPYFSNRKENYLLNLKHIHIIDVVSFWFQYSSTEYVSTKPFNGKEIEETSLGELLISPLEMADVILLGNVNKINQERLAELRWFFRKLNPLAKMMTMHDFTKENRLSSEKESLKKYTPHQLYTYQLQQFEQSKPLMTVGEYGIDTYIYRSTFPISMKQIEHFFNKLPEGILRTKAICHTPLEEQVYYISQIGPSIEVITEEQNYFKHSPNTVLSEFLFIGNQLDPQIIKQQLDDCLMMDDSLPAEKLSK